MRRSKQPPLPSYQLVPRQQVAHVPVIVLARVPQHLRMHLRPLVNAHEYVGDLLAVRHAGWVHELQRSPQQLHGTSAKQGVTHCLCSAQSWATGGKLARAGQQRTRLVASSVEAKRIWANSHVKNHRAALTCGMAAANQPSVVCDMWYPKRKRWLGAVLVSMESWWIHASKCANPWIMCLLHFIPTRDIRHTQLVGALFAPRVRPTQA